MKPEDKPSYMIYINTKWRNPVETTEYNNLKANYAKYSDAIIILSIIKGKAYLMRNHHAHCLSVMPRHVDVSEQQLTMLKLGAIPPGLLDYLNNPLPQEAIK